MQESAIRPPDSLAILVAILCLGLGALLTIQAAEIVAVLGTCLISVAVIGLVVWFSVVHKWRAMNSFGPWILIIGGPLIGAVWFLIAHKQEPPPKAGDPPTTTVASAQPLPEKQQVLSAYEIDRKLRVIDEILKLIGTDFDTEIARPVADITNSSPLAFSKPAEYAEQFAPYKKTMTRFAERLQTIRVENRVYEDIYQILDADVPISSFRESLEHYQMQTSVLGGLDMSRMTPLLTLAKTEFLKGFSSLSEWREKMQKQLLEIRKNLSH